MSRKKRSQTRVLVISNMYPSGNSYLGIFVKTQLEHLEKLGITVLKVVKNNNSAAAYLFFLIKSLFTVLFADYDLVHAHYGFHSALIPAIFKKRPLVITFHGGDALQEPFRNQTYFKLQQYVIRRAEQLIAVSSQVKEFIETRLGGCPGKTAVICCGVDTSRFVACSRAAARRQTGIPDEAKVIFFAGKIHFMKGLDVIYQCALRMPDVLFLIAGAPAYQPRTENCRYVGLIANHDLPLWLSAADIYFLPSRSEGTPVGILEALACRCPVVATRIGGCPDLLEDGINGYLIDVENPVPRGVKPDENMQFSYQIPAAQSDNIIAKLQKILDNKKLAEQMGAKGREKAAGDYDNAVIAAKINHIYQTIKALRKE